MKLVIEVDEESYKFAKECKTRKFTKHSRWSLSHDNVVNAIANGTPLENIKNEIEQLPITDTAVRLVTGILDS